ncbi:hypothetical protein [Enterococcus sp. LJL90]
MSEKIHSLTDSQLQQIVKSAVKEALESKSDALTAKNLFNDVRIDNREIELINSKYEVTNVLDESDQKSILTNISFPHGWGTSYTKVYNSEIHNSIKKLAVNVFGKTLNSDLTRNEYDLARQHYVELRDWFLASYERRLKMMQEEKKTR